MLCMLVPCFVHVVACSYRIYALAGRLGRTVLVPNYAGTAQRPRAAGTPADRCTSFGLGCGRRGRPSEPVHPSVGRTQRAGLLSLQGSLIRRAVGDRLTLTRTG